MPPIPGQQSLQGRVPGREGQRLRGLGQVGPGTRRVQRVEIGPGHLGLVPGPRGRRRGRGEQPTPSSIPWEDTSSSSSVVVLRSESA
ncbi:hypothetical protein ON010_g6958 [Phytophthora cinnamomi]|nr:hypothetical protein ON010_g6958 [Phytophthora cinnamomi]